MISCGLLVKPFIKFTKSPIPPTGSHLWQVPNLKWTLLAELHVAAKHARGQSPIAKEIYPSKKIWSSCHRTPTACQPSICTTRKKQILLSHFLTTLKAQEKTDCTSMLWSAIIDNIRAGGELGRLVVRVILAIVTSRREEFSKMVPLPFPNASLKIGFPGYWCFKMDFVRVG